MDHLALAVRDQERSRRFYEAYLGFGAAGARRYEGGVLMLYDTNRFALALGEVDEPIEVPPFFHFGKELGSPDEVRAFRERLERDGVPILEWDDDPHYVSVKFPDPDGYVVQVSWEPR